MTSAIEPGVAGADPPLAPHPLASAVYALCRFWKMVAAASLTGAAIGLCYGLMQPNSFMSTGSLLLRTGARETETAESAVAGRVAQARNIDVIATEIEILVHRDTFMRVVETVGAPRILEVYDPAANDSADTPFLSRSVHRLQSWWFASNGGSEGPASAERLQSAALRTVMGNLMIRGAVGSMIRVSYEANTPDLAKEVVDAFLSAAIERHRQVFTNRTSLEFLNTVEEDARKAAARASEALREFRAEHQIYDLEAQRTGILGELARLENQASADQEQLREHESRSEFLKSKLATETAYTEVVSDAPPAPNPEYTAVQQQLFTLHNQKGTIEGTTLDIQELKRRIEALDGLIAATQKRLQDIPQTIPGPKIRTTSKNPRHEWLRQELDKSELAIAALKATDEWRNDRLVDLKQQLETLDRLKSRYDALRGQVARHEGDSQRFQESRRNLDLLNLLDEHKLSNLQILESAYLPIRKTGPNRARWIMFGIAFGFIAGLCVALVRHRLDRFVRRAEDLQAIGFDTVVVVPEVAALRRLGGDTELDGSTDPRVDRDLDAVWVHLAPASMPAGARSTVAMMASEGSPGVTTLALQAASRIAWNQNLDVLLVETDHRRPTLAARLGLDGTPGLADLLAGTADRDAVLHPSPVPGLRVVHAGSERALEDPSKPGRRLEDALRALAEGFQFVLLDVPSIVECPEFRSLVACADRVVTVFAAGLSTKTGARTAQQAVESAGQHASGAILNRWQSVRPFWIPRSLQL